MNDWPVEREILVAVATSPDELVGALQDRIHRDVGPVRAARGVKTSVLGERDRNALGRAVGTVPREGAKT